MTDERTGASGNGPEDGPLRPSATEDVPAGPGWLEPEVDKAFAALGLPAEALRPLKDSYVGCIANTTGPVDLDVAHDACRKGLLRALKAGFTLSPEALMAFEQSLEAVEADLTASL